MLKRTKGKGSSENAFNEDHIDLAEFSDSSDEGTSGSESGEGAAPIDVGKLPTVAKDDASVARRLAAAKKQQKSGSDTGVVYLGRIPHGFYEDEMKAYFSQFGDVTRLRMARNKKTGRSKHYAFIEFSSKAVAEIVAETMHNYLLLGHILQCKLLQKDEIHPELWVGANKKWRNVKQDRVERQRFNQKRSDEQQEKAERRLLSRQEEKKRKLAEMGIDYDMSAVEYKKAR